MEAEKKKYGAEVPRPQLEKASTKRIKENGQKSKSIKLMQDEIWTHSPDLIRKFLDGQSGYEQLCGEVEYILKKRVNDASIEVSNICARAKTLNSFLEKIQWKPYKEPFDQITDFAGARVVCLYSSDLEKVAEIIRREFDVVEEVDKLGELDVNQFGYGARHFIVKLGEASSGARYDSLRHLKCEIQIRTVVQDAWSIIQHHMIYKRESEIPSQLQRKLYGLAGLFETVDDQFENIRQLREQYLASVRDSQVSHTVFLGNELNLDSFREYLKWKMPGRQEESYEGQSRAVLDQLLSGGFKKLSDVDEVMENTAKTRKLLIAELYESSLNISRCDDGTFPSNIEPGLAFTLACDTGAAGFPWGADWRVILEKHRGKPL